MNSVQAFPLHWPTGRKRTQFRKRADFHRRVEKQSSLGVTYIKESLTIADSRDRLYHELRQLGGTSVIISSNLELKLDGTPRSGQREPSDPGIAVYFQMNKQPHCLSCDAWDRCADNLAAIAKHVEAMRGQLRWGVADVATMFSGFKALPNAIITPEAMSVEDAARFVGKWSGVTTGTVMARSCYQDCYRAAVKKLHPDANGGVDRPEWHQLQQAAEVLRGHLGL